MQRDAARSRVYENEGRGVSNKTIGDKRNCVGAKQSSISNIFLSIRSLLLSLLLHICCIICMDIDVDIDTY